MSRPGHPTTLVVARCIESLRNALFTEYGVDYAFSVMGKGRLLASSDSAHGVHEAVTASLVKVSATYVKITGMRGFSAYAVQLPADNQWGFELAQADGEWSQSWPGGFGLATEWTAVSCDKVPPRVRKEMGHLLPEPSSDPLLSGWLADRSPTGRAAAILVTREAPDKPWTHRPDEGGQRRLVGRGHPLYGSKEDAILAARFEWRCSEGKPRSPRPTPVDTIDASISPEVKRTEPEDAVTQEDHRGHKGTCGTVVCRAQEGE
jgi:hypothetical protein